MGCADHFEAPIKMLVSAMLGKRQVYRLICRGLLDYSCLSTILSILADVSKNFIWQGLFF